MQLVSLRPQVQSFYVVLAMSDYKSSFSYGVFLAKPEMQKMLQIHSIHCLCIRFQTHLLNLTLTRILSLILHHQKLAGCNPGSNCKKKVFTVCRCNMFHSDKQAKGRNRKKEKKRKIDLLQGGVST